MGPSPAFRNSTPSVGPVAQGLQYLPELRVSLCALSTRTGLNRSLASGSSVASLLRSAALEFPAPPSSA